MPLNGLFTGLLFQSTKEGPVKGFGFARSEIYFEIVILLGYLSHSLQVANCTNPFQV